MATQQPTEIVATPDVLGGKPRLEGTRLGVHFLATLVEDGGWDPHVVAEEYELPIAAVYRALTYYHEHPEEMAAIKRRNEEIDAELAADPDVPTTPEELAAWVDRTDAADASE
jgi:uncharacterized protein (DUF433 family)